MKKTVLLAAITCLVPALMAHAQTPEQPIQQVRGLKHHAWQVKDAAADAYAQQHAYQYSHHSQVNQVPQAGAYCPSTYYGGGYCRGWGSDVGCYPRHNYTYSYKRPSHLVYPQQNAVGGAVVYPYYTHKGPSDFFQK